MKLTFYVHPERYAHATQFPMYRRKFSVEGEKVAAFAEMSELFDTGEKLLEQFIAYLKSTDTLLIKGITEEDIRQAHVGLSFAHLCPLPQGKVISPDQWFAMLVDNDGVVLGYTTNTMMRGTTPDVDFIKKEQRRKKHR